MSALTFHNATPYIAQYVVRRGDQVIARLPGIAPNASVTVPSNSSFDVSATTILEGNTYTSAPVTVNAATLFLAQVKQHLDQGTYDFEVVTTPSSAANQMQFAKTSLAPVTFTIAQHGVPLQSVVVQDSFAQVALDMSDVYSIYAVINGITTDTTTTSNPNAVVTATSDTSEMDMGYFKLIVS